MKMVRVTDLTTNLKRDTINIKTRGTRYLWWIINAMFLTRCTNKDVRWYKYKPIENLNEGEEVLSIVIPNLPDEDLGFGQWSSFTSTYGIRND